MKFRKETPTKAYLENCDNNTFDALKKHCSYSNSSIGFQLRKHLKNKHWRDKCQREGLPDWENKRLELVSKKDHCLLNKDENGWYLFPGYINHLPKKFEYTIQDNIDYPDFKLLAWKNKFPHKLYTCQQETIDSMLENPHCHAELATGSGKTAILVELAQKTGNTIIVTPSKDLFNDLLEKAKFYLGENNVGYYGDGKKKIGKPVTVCIAKSLTMIKPHTKEWEFFSTRKVVISDECHTNPASTLEKTFHNLLGNVPYRWFLSGTAVRGDGTGKMLKSIIGPKIYGFNTKQGIEAGILNPLEFRIVNIKPENSKRSKDPMIEKRNHFLRNRNLGDFYIRMANLLWEKKQENTLILVEEIEQIFYLAKYLRVPFTYAHGNVISTKDYDDLVKKYKIDTVSKRTDNKKNIEDFNRGKFKVFIGTSCVSTGTNFFANHHTMNWQGGGSETITKQGVIGRSVRLLHMSEYADFHKERPVTIVWDANITGVPKMGDQLDIRVKYYEETGCPIRYVGK
jgi:superfamily II DNA or RNA helicase